MNINGVLLIGALVWSGLLLAAYILHMIQNPSEQRYDTSNHQQPARPHGETEMVNPPGVDPAADENEQQFQHQHWRAEEEHWKRQRRIGNWLNCITALAAGAGLYGLFVLHGTMKATQESADAARASADLIRENRRGWILFSESKGPQLPLVADKQPLIALGFKNFGSGIAKYVTTYFGLEIEPECKPVWEGFRMFPSFWKEEAIVAPPGKMLWTTPDLGMTLNTVQINSLSPPKPTNKFCMFGYISYFDEFGVKHGTMFCLWYNLTLPPDTLSYCPTDNDAW